MRLQQWVSHISLRPRVEWLCRCLWRAVDGALLQGAHRKAKCHDAPHLPPDLDNLENSIRCKNPTLLSIRTVVQKSEDGGDYYWYTLPVSSCPGLQVYSKCLLCDVD